MKEGRREAIIGLVTKEQMDSEPYFIFIPLMFFFVFSIFVSKEISAFKSQDSVEKMQSEQFKEEVKEIEERPDDSQELYEGLQ